MSQKCAYSLTQTEATRFGNPELGTSGYAQQCRLGTSSLWAQPPEFTASVSLFLFLSHCDYLVSINWFISASLYLATCICPDCVTQPTALWGQNAVFYRDSSHSTLSLFHTWENLCFFFPVNPSRRMELRNFFLHWFFNVFSKKNKLLFLLRCRSWRKRIIDCFASFDESNQSGEWGGKFNPEWNKIK